MKESNQTFTDVPVKKPSPRSPGDLLRFADGSEAKGRDGWKSGHLDLSTVRGGGNKVVDQRLSAQGII